MPFKPSPFNLSLYCFPFFLSQVPEVGYKQVVLALTHWFEQSSISSSLDHILIVPVYSRTAYFDICIIGFSCSNTTCSNSPGACSALPKCSCSAQDAELYSQLPGSSSLITRSPLFWGALANDFHCRLLISHTSASCHSSFFRKL